MPSSDAFFLPCLSNTRKATSLWSSEELGRLRALAQKGEPLSQISAILRRSQSAIRNKANMHGISIQTSKAPHGRDGIPRANIDAFSHDSCL